MSMLDSIKNSALLLRKNSMYSETADDLKQLYKDKALTLTTVIGEVETAAKRNNKPITDDMVIAVIKKTVDGILETLEIKQDDKLAQQAHYLKGFLPQQMSEDELKEVIQQIINNLPAPVKMGVVMQQLKEKHSGLYDAKLASNLLKDML